MIPEELKQQNRWVCYNSWKEPINAKTGYGASSTNSKTWCPYEEAVAGMKKHNLSGIGFVLGDGFSGIDIDKCVDKGIISSEAQSIIDSMDSYTELSPSGTGIHILCKGKKQGIKCKSKDIKGAKEIEIYDNARYFTLTGNVVVNQSINERNAQLKEVKKLELVTNIDVAALAICCDAYSKYVKATSDINKVGLLVSYTNKGGNKNVTSNPLINIATKYSEIYKKYCNEFGLTPNSRIKLTVNKVFEKENPLALKGFGDV